MNVVLGALCVENREWEASMGFGRIRQANGHAQYHDWEYSERSFLTLFSPNGSFTHSCHLSHGSRNRKLL